MVEKNGGEHGAKTLERGESLGQVQQFRAVPSKSKWFGNCSDAYKKLSACVRACVCACVLITHNKIIDISQ